MYTLIGESLNSPALNELIFMHSFISIYVKIAPFQVF